MMDRKRKGKVLAAFGGEMIYLFASCMVISTWGIFIEMSQDLYACSSMRVEYTHRPTPALRHLSSEYITIFLDTFGIPLSSRCESMSRVGL